MQIHLAHVLHVQEIWCRKEERAEHSRCDVWWSVAKTFVYLYRFARLESFSFHRFWTSGPHQMIRHVICREGYSVAAAGQRKII